MVEKISKYIVDKMLLTDEPSIDNNQREIMQFGMTRILEDTPKFIGIFIICYIMNIINELLVVIFVTLVYKTFIGGCHARTNIGCFLVSTTYFILPIMFAKYINYDIKIFYFIYICTMFFSIYVVKKIAPADTAEIPIINREKRKKMKISAYVSLIIISILVCIFIEYITYMKIILYAIFLINLFAIKPVYKILRCKYGYESEEYSSLYN